MPLIWFYTSTAISKRIIPISRIGRLWEIPVCSWPFSDILSFRIYERVVEMPSTDLPLGTTFWLGQRNNAHGYFKVLFSLSLSMNLKWKYSLMSLQKYVSLFMAWNKNPGCPFLLHVFLIAFFFGFLEHLMMYLFLFMFIWECWIPFSYRWFWDTAYRYWDLNLGPLEEHTVLSTTGSSLQLHLRTILNW